ncbi:MAG: sigma-54-dependent Fis family transcriptional regulator [Candidatus Eisenbacteria sp.]|nr:sigma-54-dependent Fis family transcriptional regulator [Candidatus Eisenbacteria bacterium]
MTRPRVLVIDDEPLVRRSMRRVLADQGFDVITAASVAEGFAAFDAHRPPVIVLDVKLPDGSGLDMLSRLRKVDPGVKIVVVTAFGETANAVRAMKLGATDFLKKPYDLEELLHAVRSAAQSLTRERQLKGYRKRDQTRFARCRMIGHCPAMQAVRETIRKVVRSDTTTVLLTGESGTGKELVARSIHFESSRRDSPLMEINCSTFQDALLENELFGHEKGAFTGASYLKRGLVELCDGGTLFLDEVSEMLPRVQAKLLRFIDNTSFKRVGGNVDLTVDIRMVAATNADLEERIRSQSFRQDLYFRLKVVSLRLPPLRERGEDILLLAHAFLERYSQEFHKGFSRIAAPAQQVLRRYPWPGNVRELENLTERVVLLEEGPELELCHLPAELQQAAARRGPVGRMEGEPGLGEEVLEALTRRLAQQGLEPLPSLREVGDVYVNAVLDACGGNRSRAARTLRLSRQGLLDRLKRIGQGAPSSPSVPRC